MTTYVCLLWDCRSFEANQCAYRLKDLLHTSNRQWALAWEAGGITVLARLTSGHRLETLVLPQRAGVIIGPLWRSRQNGDDQPFPRPAFDACMTDALLESEGKTLVENFWGNYVAVLRSPGGTAHWVVKDPTGSLPCYFLNYQGVIIFFASLSDIDCLNMPLTLDREYLHTRMLLGMTSQPQAAFRQVSRLYGGECLRVDQAQHTLRTQRRWLWTPHQFSKQCVEDPMLAALAVRSVVRACTQTLALDHPRLLHRLSGGLDSSILHSALIGSACHVTAYTYFDPQGTSDERAWARRVAATGGLHVEIPLDASYLDLSVVEKQPVMVEPSPVMSFLQRYCIETPLARAHQTSAVFSGDGGDSGFGAFVAVDAVQDHLRDHGPSLTLWPLARMLALRTDRTVWTVLMRAIGASLLPLERGLLQQHALAHTKLVPRDFVSSFRGTPSTLHPWFAQAGAGALPKRLGQLLLAPMHAPLSVGGIACPDILTPLYAQPVVETLLRIPSYTLFHGGRDRGLARLAFSNDVPRSIIDRQWKDRAPGFFERLIVANRTWLRDVLLEGALAREGLLDRTALERALTGSIGSRVDPSEIFRHLDTELWARPWLGMSAKSRTAA